MTEKSCSQCDITKPLTEFYKRSDTYDGRHPYCKECFRKYDAIRYYKDHEKMLEKGRARYKKDKAPFVAAVLRARERHPEKAKARQDLRNAVAAGKIKRLPCSECGNPKSHAHHPDYSKPLDVKWLCVTHHMIVHRKYQALNPFSSREEITQK